MAISLHGCAERNAAPKIDGIGGFADCVLVDLEAAKIGPFDLLAHSTRGVIVQKILCRRSERIDLLILYGNRALELLPGGFETIRESTTRASADGVRASCRFQPALMWCICKSPDHSLNP